MLGEVALEGALGVLPIDTLVRGDSGVLAALPIGALADVPGVLPGCASAPVRGGICVPAGGGVIKTVGVSAGLGASAFTSSCIIAEDGDVLCISETFGVTGTSFSDATLTGVGSAGSEDATCSAVGSSMSTSNVTICLSFSSILFYHSRASVLTQLPFRLQYIG